MDVARELLGMTLFSDGPGGVVGGTIVETEAYGGPDDRASHARAGRTRRTEPMFGPPGHAYVYLVYGMHWCLNVVTETDGVAGAVLLRALMPTVGIEIMRARRGRPSEPVARLAAGPARLCHALGVDASHDRLDLTAGVRLWLADTRTSEDSDTSRLGTSDIVAGPRVGVTYAGADWAARPWRLGVRGHPALSRPFPRQVAP